MSARLLQRVPAAVFLRRMRRVPAAVVLLGALASLAACGFSKPDLRYQDSRLLDPLAVPGDLADPPYSASMEIPPAGTPGAAAEAAVPVPAADGLEIEQPPDMRADGPAPGQE